MIAALVILFILKLRFPRGTQLSTVIVRRYGRQGLQRFRRLEKTSIKLKKNEADLKFLKTYRLKMTVDIVESFQINDDCSIGDFIYIETTLPERNPTINCNSEKIWPSRTATL